MRHKAESTYVGSKVLPICNVASGPASQASGSTDVDYHCHASLNKKKRAISRMKELLRRAVTAKSEKGENKPWKVLLLLDDTQTIKHGKYVYAEFI